MVGPSLRLVVGTSQDFTIQVVPFSGSWSNSANSQTQASQYSPVLLTGSPAVYGTSPFLGTDTLATSLWAGHAQPSILSPTTTWVDAPNGVFLVSFLDADTTDFNVGRYRIQTTAKRSTRTSVIFDGWIEITASPGVEATLLAFTHYDDLLQYATWLQDIQTDQDEEAFAHQQSRATNRLIDMLVQQWKPDRIWPRFGNAGAVLQWTVGWPSMPPSYWLRQQLIPLVPNSTIPTSMPARFSTTPNFIDPTIATTLLLYDDVKEVVAKYAIAMICEQQIGRAGGGETYREMAHRYRREASALYRCRRFELDLGTPQTGYTWFNIDGGATNLR